MKKTGFIRSASAAAILGLTLTMGGVTAAAQDNPHFPIIGENERVTLTINKRLNPTSIGGPGKGVADPNATGKPLNGAKFTGTLLDVSGVEPADLGKLTAVNFGDKGARKTSTTVSGTTVGNGELKFDSEGTEFRQGVWLFEESIEDTVTVAGTNETYEASQVAPSSPFIVTLPYTNPDGTGWNRNVTVQPKNTTSGITKAVKDADKNVGDKITYVVKGDVPVISENERLKAFRIEDQVDVENLEEITAQVSISNGDPLLPDDFNLTISDQGKVVVTVTNLEVLAGRPAGTTIELTISAKVKPQSGTDGIAVNQAQQYIHYPNQEKETMTESNEVKSYWGVVNVVKTEDNAETRLAGAEFELFRCAKNGEQDPVVEGEKLTVGGASKWTTNDHGTVLIDGLHVTNIENHVDEISKWYCLVETKAPRGYVKNEKPHPFQLVSKDETLKTQSPVQYEANIKNTRSEMPQLPLTGGMGIGLLAALAALVAGLAAWFARRASSKA